MIFNSLVFLVFAALFFPLYFSMKGRQRMWVCLSASYVFYGWWDWRFLSLILFSTVMDWWFGLWISYQDHPEETRQEWLSGSVVLKTFGRFTEAVAQFGLSRKAILVFSLVMNLGFLGFYPTKKTTVWHKDVQPVLPVIKNKVPPCLDMNG